MKILTVEVSLFVEDDYAGAEDDISGGLDLLDDADELDGVLSWDVTVTSERPYDDGIA